MNNFRQPGDTIEITAAAALASGQPVEVGQLVGFATKAAAIGEKVNVKVTGVFDVTKAGTQAWTPGALVYFDGTVFTTVASGNKLAGVSTVTVGAGAGETAGTIRLNGSAATTPA